MIRAALRPLAVTSINFACHSVARVGFLLALATTLAFSAAQAITLTPIATEFNTPIGIDHHAPSNRVVLSVNYATGGIPYNFELVAADGTRQQFSTISGLADEVKIGTAKDDGGGMSLGGFTAGELFTGTGAPGHVARIAADGGSLQNPWVILPGETGLMRGGLHVDRTGVFGGDLIVVTNAGGVWRVNEAGVPTLLANLATHLEGLVTVPDDVARYGPWAGKILVGAEGQGLIYTVAPNGSSASYDLGINVEDIDIVPENQNFFGVDFGGATLWGADAPQWTSMVGDFVIAMEYGPLYHVRWNGSSFDTQVLSSVASQWEHVTFSTAGVPCVPPVCTITGDTSFCQGGTTELCGPVAQGASYSWTGPVDFTSDQQCITVGGAGLYTLTITVPCVGATPVSSTCDVTIVEDPAPLCTITGPDSLCDGQSAELCGPEGDYTYLWSTGETARCIMIDAVDNYTLTVTNPATGCVSISGGSPVPTRTAWQMHDGLEVTPSNPLGLLEFDCTPIVNGDICEYDVATIPTQGDAAWGPAPDPNIINFSIASRVCSAPIQCGGYGDFTYFQTLVDIPVGGSVTEFTITFAGMDDGARVSVFNSTYPTGLVVPGSYVFLGGAGTTNLAPFVVVGELNRVVITQVDDCCSQNNLQSALVVLNGQTVSTPCSKYVRAGLCTPPPVVLDAFPIFDNNLPSPDRVDSVMVVFDQPVETASAEDVGNYVLGSGGVVEGARRLDAPEGYRVVLQIRGVEPDGYNESLTVSGVRSLETLSLMNGPRTKYFINGVLALGDVVAPDPDGLEVDFGGEGEDMCRDYPRFLPEDEGEVVRISFSGTVTGRYGPEYTLQDAPDPRAGLWATVTQAGLLNVGHTYLLSATVDVFGAGTRASEPVYVRDLGPGPSFPPIIQSIRNLTDDTCDDGQRFLTGKDYEGMLVNVDRVVVVDDQPPGGNFYVRIQGAGSGPAPGLRGSHPFATEMGPQDQIQIINVGANFNFAAVAGRVVSVTGVLQGLENGQFALFPRNDSDILDFGPMPTFTRPLDISKSATLSRDPDIVRGINGELFMAWWRVHYESVHSLSLDNTQNWSTAVPVSNQGAQPALAVTPSNRIGVLNAGVDELFFKQSTDGGFQMDPLVTTVDPNGTQYPALTVGSGENFHAAWERTGVGIFYSGSNGGSVFSTPIDIATNSGSGQNSLARIVASSADHVFVFWQYDEPGLPGVHRVLYRRSTDGGASFGPARRVRDEANPLTSTVKLAYLGDAQIGSDGTLYVMGLDEAGAIEFLKSTNDGLSFNLVSSLPEPAPRGSLCPKSFAVGSGGQIHSLVGECGVALYYSRSDDGGATWGPQVDVTRASSPNVGEPRGAKIILDGTGTPVIVWFSSVGGSTEVYSSRLLD